MDFFWIPRGIWGRIRLLGTGSGGRISEMKSHIREIEKVRLSVDHRGPISGLFRDRSSLLD
jgi:hypothetical protein